VKHAPIGDDEQPGLSVVVCLRGSGDGLVRDDEARHPPALDDARTLPELGDDVVDRSCVGPFHAHGIGSGSGRLKRAAAGDAGTRAIPAERIWTIGHGRRPIEELVACLEQARAKTLVDVRRYPASRRNPQFNQLPLAEALEQAGIVYRHAVGLGGRLSDEPGADRFACLREPAFRSYAARIGTAEWQAALAMALAEPAPCFMCAETLWWKCHRRLIADLLEARGHEVFHLLRPHEVKRHRHGDEAEAIGGRLYLCGELVA
jgi:hypothetical protein